VGLRRQAGVIAHHPKGIPNYRRGSRFRIKIRFKWWK